MSERRRVPPVTKMKRRPKGKGVKNLNGFKLTPTKMAPGPKGTVIASDNKGKDLPSREEIDANWERIFGKGKYD